MEEENTQSTQNNQNTQEDPWNVTGQNGLFTKDEAANAADAISLSATDLGTISLVLGIISFFLFKGPFAVLALLLGIISRHRQPKNNGKATAGIVCGIISLVLTVIGYIVIITLIASIFPALERFFDSISEVPSQW